MPRRVKPDWIPKYRLHRPSGQAVVSLSGRDFYLGAHGTEQSRAEYDRLIAEWIAAGRGTPPRSGARGPTAETTVAELILAYWAYVGQHYTRSTACTTMAALRPLRELYGHTLVAEFGPMSLRAIQRKLESSTDAAGNPALSRSTVNHYLARIRQAFKWGAAEGLVPAAVWHGLGAVAGLRRGRTTARETEPVRPVEDVLIEATLPHLPAAVADMVRFQRLTGMRPGEVCGMTRADLRAEGELLVYAPREHKTAHRGLDRVVPIGPRARAILEPHLRPEMHLAVFRPKRKNRGEGPAHGGYTEAGYRRAIRRACEAKGLRDWRPNQLRHSRASEIRRQFGLDAAGSILGHARLETTQVYAERDRELARKVAMATG